MFDLKNIKVALQHLENERGIPHEKMVEALESAFAAAYKREYAEYNQLIRSKFDIESGELEFFQAKRVVDEKNLVTKEEKVELPEEDQKIKVVFDLEKHILLEDAKKIRSNVIEGEEILFPLELKMEFGRIAAQSAKHAIMQKLREVEKDIVISEFSEKAGTIVSGEVRRFERGNLYIGLGRATAVLPFAEQIRGERFKQGEMIRAYVLKVDEDAKRGNFITLSRASEKFIEKLFELETPEILNGQVQIKKVVRNPGMRTKLIVDAVEGENVDPIGALVGQRGVRVLTVMNELRGERIDVIEWSDDKTILAEDAISPASVVEVEEIDDTTVKLVIDKDQAHPALGMEGANLSLAAKLIGLNIELHSPYGELIAKSNSDGEVEILIETERNPYNEPRNIDNPEHLNHTKLDRDDKSENDEEETDKEETDKEEVKESVESVETDSVDSNVEKPESKVDDTKDDDTVDAVSDENTK